MFIRLWLKVDALEKWEWEQKGDEGGRATTLSRTAGEKRNPSDHCYQIPKPKYEM